MNEQGQQLYQALAQARGIFVEIARMLADCDRLMEQHGWIAPKSESVSGISASIHIPEKWTPHAVHRLYRKDGDSNTIKVVAALVEDEHLKSVAEPIVTGSRFDTVENDLIGLYGWDHTWWWFKWIQKDPDGSPHELKPETYPDAEYAKNFRRFTRIRAFGRPLAKMTNTQDLESQIVRPLVEI
jgi:hypothetical protein